MEKSWKDILKLLAIMLVIFLFFIILHSANQVKSQYQNISGRRTDRICVGKTFQYCFQKILRRHPYKL